MAKKRTKIIPIIHDARKPLEYRFLVGMVDLVFADVAQPDQARIISQNCYLFLKNDGHFLISIKASCIDSTNEPDVVFANQVQKLKEYGLKPKNNQLKNLMKEIMQWLLVNTDHDFRTKLTYLINNLNINQQIAFFVYLQSQSNKI